MSDITTTATDDRADSLVAAVLDCGFAVHRHDGPDDVNAFLEGVRAIQTDLVVICARGISDPELVRPFVLAIPEVEYILVAGDRPHPATEREGDAGARGYYLDGVEHPEELRRTMAFVSRGLGIVPPAPSLPMGRS